MEDKTKTCSNCKEKKLPSEFYKCKANKDGYQFHCISCKKAYYDRNKTKLLQYSKTYDVINKEKRTKQHKDNYENNKDKILSRQKSRYYNNKENINRQKKEYRLRNKDKIATLNRSYRQENKDKRLRYERDRYHTDELFNTISKLRRRIKQAIKYHHKSAKTLELLGCELNQLKKWLQYQAEQDNLDTNQKMHLDHISPCSMFDMSDSEQQQLCFNWKNLRYCLPDENLRKKDKIDEALIKRYKDMADDFELLYKVD